MGYSTLSYVVLWVWTVVGILCPKIPDCFDCDEHLNCLECKNGFILASGRCVGPLHSSCTECERIGALICCSCPSTVCAFYDPTCTYTSLLSPSSCTSSRAFQIRTPLHPSPSMSTLCGICHPDSFFMLQLDSQIEYFRPLSGDSLCDMVADPSRCEWSSDSLRWHSGGSFFAPTSDHTVFCIEPQRHFPALKAPVISQRRQLLTLLSSSITQFGTYSIPQMALITLTYDVAIDASTTQYIYLVLTTSDRETRIATPVEDIGTVSLSDSDRTVNIELAEGVWRDATLYELRTGDPNDQVNQVLKDVNGDASYQSITFFTADSSTCAGNNGAADSCRNAGCAYDQATGSCLDDCQILTGTTISGTRLEGTQYPPLDVATFDDCVSRCRTTPSCAAMTHIAGPNLCLLWDLPFTTSADPSVTASICILPSDAPTSTPSVSPSIDCADFTDETECRDAMCAFDLQDNSCSANCVLEPGVVLNGVSASTAINFDSNSLGECERQCLEIPDCVSAHWNGVSICMFWSSYFAKFDSQSATAIHCVSTPEPTLAPTVSQPSVAPSKDCLSIQDAEECRNSGCAYNGENCDYGCQVFQGRLLDALPIIPLKITESVQECMDLCLENVQCNFFCLNINICTLHTGYTSMEDDAGENVYAGTCLGTTAPTVSPSMDPTAIPTSTEPSLSPSCSPSTGPSLAPTVTPSDSPSAPPSIAPSSSPSLSPSSQPSTEPSTSPTSSEPTQDPSSGPSESQPTAFPTVSPSSDPTTAEPSKRPTVEPTDKPRTGPSVQPSSSPSWQPSNQSAAPSAMPSTRPSLSPSNPPTGVCDSIFTIEECRAAGCAYNLDTCSNSAVQTMDIVVTSSLQAPQVRPAATADACVSFCLASPTCVASVFSSVFCQLFDHYDSTSAQLGAITSFTVVTHAPSAVPTAMPTLEPSAACTLLQDENACRSAGCSWSRWESLCVFECSVPEADTVFMGLPVDVDPVTTGVDCQSSCLQDPTCQLYSEIGVLCYRFQTYISSLSFPGATSAFCVVEAPTEEPTSTTMEPTTTKEPTETPEPTDTPRPTTSGEFSTDSPTPATLTEEPTFTTAPPTSRNCEDFDETDLVTCRNAGCMWDDSTRTCEYTCARVDNMFITGFPYDNLSGSDFLSCEAVCIANPECAGFSVLFYTCFLFKEWSSMSPYGGAVVGQCYRTTFPSVSPSLSPSTSRPSTSPTTSIPSVLPSTTPSTANPTVDPSTSPSTSEPSVIPTLAPSSSKPSTEPSLSPTSSEPTDTPLTSGPSSSPSTSLPTSAPSSSVPSTRPTAEPSFSSPTVGPSLSPSTSIPTTTPSNEPSLTPTFATTTPPSVRPTKSPTDAPTEFCVTLYFSCGTMFDGTYSLRDTTWQNSAVWDQKDGSGLLFTSELPGFSWWSGTRWVFSNEVDTNILLVSADYEDDFPRGSSDWWLLKDFAYETTYSCDLEALDCSGTQIPTTTPSSEPSKSPTVRPSDAPSTRPSVGPSTRPSVRPSCSPSVFPTVDPSVSPSVDPSFGPSSSPSTSLPTADPSLTPTASPTESPTYPCIELTFNCSTEFDGVYRARDFDNPGLAEWSAITLSGQESVLYAIDWPEELSEYNLDGLHWTFHFLEPTRMLISKNFEDDFPRGAETWYHVNLVTLSITSEIQCGEESISCLYTPRPTEFPSVSPVIAAPTTVIPTQNPTSTCPSVSPSQQPTNSPTDSPTDDCDKLDFTCNTLYDGFYRRIQLQPPIYSREDGSLLFTHLQSDGSTVWRFTANVDQFALDSVQTTDDNFPHSLLEWNFINLNPYSILYRFVCLPDALVCGGSAAPSVTPTVAPTGAPTSSEPTGRPTTSRPTFRPSAAPSRGPSFSEPSAAPTLGPSTSAPSTAVPTAGPSRAPSTAPSSSPSDGPTTSRPTERPSEGPSLEPSSSEPTLRPSDTPTSSEPTSIPTSQPSENPSIAPTSSEPTNYPLTSAPTTSEPSYDPSLPPTTSVPTMIPTNHPVTEEPTFSPSAKPTDSPTDIPVAKPTGSPSLPPTGNPTTASPSFDPSKEPSAMPSKSPTVCPSQSPTGKPSETPCIDEEELGTASQFYDTCMELTTVGCDVYISPGVQIRDLCCYTCYLREFGTTVNPICIDEDQLMVTVNDLLWESTESDCSGLAASPWPYVSNIGGYGTYCDAPIIESTETIEPTKTDILSVILNGTDQLISEICAATCLCDGNEYQQYQSSPGNCVDAQGAQPVAYLTYKWADTDPVCRELCTNDLLCWGYTDREDRVCMVHGPVDLTDSERLWTTVLGSDFEPKTGNGLPGATCYIKVRDTNPPTTTPQAEPTLTPTVPPSLAPSYHICNDLQFFNLNLDLTEAGANCILLIFELNPFNYEAQKYDMCDCFSLWDAETAAKYDCAPPEYTLQTIEGLWEVCDLGLPSKSPTLTPTSSPTEAPQVHTCSTEETRDILYSSQPIDPNIQSSQDIEACEGLYLHELAETAMPPDLVCECFQHFDSVPHNCIFATYPIESTASLVVSCRNPTTTPTSQPSPTSPTNAPTKGPSRQPSDEPTFLPSSEPSEEPSNVPSPAPFYGVCDDLEGFLDQYTYHTCVVLKLYIEVNVPWDDSQLCACLKVIPFSDVENMTCTVLPNDRRTLTELWLEYQTIECTTLL